MRGPPGLEPRVGEGTDPNQELFLLRLCLPGVSFRGTTGVDPRVGESANSEPLLPSSLFAKSFLQRDDRVSVHGLGRAPIRQHFLFNFECQVCPSEGRPGTSRGLGRAPNRRHFLSVFVCMVLPSEGRSGFDAGVGEDADSETFPLPNTTYQSRRI